MINGHFNFWLLFFFNFWTFLSNFSSRKLFELIMPGLLFYYIFAFEKCNILILERCNIFRLVHTLCCPGWNLFSHWNMFTNCSNINTISKMFSQFLTSNIIPLIASNISLLHWVMYTTTLWLDSKAVIFLDSNVTFWYVYKVRQLSK